MKGTLNRTSWRRPEMVLAFVAAIALLIGACGGGGGVAEARAGFIAEMRSFTVQAPAADEAMASEDADADVEADADADAAADADVEADADADAAADADAEAEGDMPAEPAMVNVMLDILVHNEGAGTLDGITVDLTIADPDGVEKERRLLWIETAGLTKGSQSQVVYDLEQVAYTEGDGFHVEVRYPIPMEERGDYREFDVEQ